MSVPDYSAQIKKTFDKKPRDMTTNIGCSRLRGDVTLDLYSIDERCGELIKKPGQTQGYDHFAVDNFLYKSDIPGQSTAVDFIAASMSTDARLQYSPDIPRYSPQDWMKPVGDVFKLPPHNCKLGTSLFCAPAAYKFKREWLLLQLEWMRQWKIDFVVVYACVGGDLFNTGDGTYADPWKYAGSFLSWPDYDSVIGNTIDLIYDYGIQTFLVYCGGAGQVPTRDSQIRLAERIAHIEKPKKEKVFGRSMWNEWYVTGGNKSNIRAMAAAVRIILGPDALIALDTPAAAPSAPVGEAQDTLPQEAEEFYAGSAANLYVPQWDRSQPNPRYSGHTCESLNEISIEPRGPGASTGGNTQNELYLSNDYIQSAMRGCIGQVLHTGAGVFGPLKNNQFAQDQTVNIYDYQNMPAIIAAMAEVRAGKVPDDGGNVVTPYPGDDKFKVVGAYLEHDYERAKQYLNGDSAVWFSRTIWDNVEGDETGKKYTLDESIAKHRKEWCAALGVPVDDWKPPV